MKNFPNGDIKSEYDANRDLREGAEADRVQREANAIPTVLPNEFQVNSGYIDFAPLERYLNFVLEKCTSSTSNLSGWSWRTRVFRSGHPIPNSDTISKFNSLMDDFIDKVNSIGAENNTKQILMQQIQDLKELFRRESPEKILKFLDQYKRVYRDLKSQAFQEASNVA